MLILCVIAFVYQMKIYGIKGWDILVTKNLSIVSKLESVLGIPKLSKMSNVVYGPCQLGKQTKAKHPGTQTSATSRLLELLHLDPMIPTRTESLSGKRYIMVVVDDFTRYTWVILL